VAETVGFFSFQCKGGDVMRYFAQMMGLLTIGIILLTGCGGPSPIAGLVDFVKDDPAAKKFLKSWPLPEEFEQTGDPSFERTRTVTPGKEVVRYKEIHFSGLAGNLDQSAVLEFYRVALTKQGYEVTGGEGGLSFRSEKWSGEVTVSAESPPVVNVDAEQS
jgi:hypothetical protein